MNYAYVLLHGLSKRKIVSVMVDPDSNSDREAVSNALEWLNDFPSNVTYDVLDIWNLIEDSFVCSLTF